MTIWIPICLSIVCLVLFISVFKIPTLISFLLVSFGLGFMGQLNFSQSLTAISKGMGSTLGAILPILVIGAMVGKLIAKSNAAAVLSEWLVKKVGVSRLPIAFMIIGFVVGMPLFFSVAFLLLVPLLLAAAARYRFNPVYLGMPMLASLSVTQGYLPPHPAPYYLVTHLAGADMGITLGLGVLISIPAILISGLWFGRSFKNIPANPMNFIQQGQIENPPSIFASLAVLLLPVILIAAKSFAPNAAHEKSPFAMVLNFMGEPIIALLISLAVAVYLLAFKRKIPWTETQSWFSEAARDVTPLILTFAGAGAYKEILQEIHVGEQVIGLLQGTSVNPLILTWTIAAIIRIITGSSTVSGITTAALVGPIILNTGVNVNLIVLSIGAGSMVLSHVNDGGFWLFREYFGVSTKDTLRSWTIMETLIAITGLGGVLLLHYIFFT